MQESLITFETAKLAKEKEFKINEHLSIDDENPRNLKSNYNPREYQPWYFNLTQSLLQKWLREVHNIKVFVTTNTEVNAKYSYIVLYPPTKGWSLSRDKFLRWTNTKGSLADESYEKILEEGLQEGLKLIPEKT
jgi:hypothetical protein